MIETDEDEMTHSHALKCGVSMKKEGKKYV